MSLQAYQRAAEQAEGPKQTEFRLFGLVTRALMDAAQTDASDHRGRMKALHWDRRLWTSLTTDSAEPSLEPHDWGVFVSRSSIQLS